MDAMALSLLIKAQGAEQAKRTLGEIDLIGKNIAKNYSSTFAIVGASADKAAARVSQTFDRSSSSVTSSFGRIGSKATGVAAGIASMGDVGASSLQRIVTASSSVAFGFGPAGAIVAAAGVAALAIVGIFTRARDEMKRTVEASRAWLESLDQGTALSTAKAINELSQGRRFAKDPFDQMGIQGLERRRRELEASIGATPRTLAAGTMHSVESEAAKALRAELARVNEALAVKNRRMAEGLEILERQGGVEGGITIATSRREAAERAAPEAERVARARRDFAVKHIEDSMDAVNDEIARRAPNLQNMITEALAVDPIKFKSNIAELLNDPTLFASEVPSGITTAAQDRLREEIEDWAVSLRDQISYSIGDAIATGFAVAFARASNIGEGFKHLGRAVLSGLGSIFVQMGQKMIMASSLMIAFQKALMAFSGIAGLGIGIALVALGASMGAIAGRAGQTGHGEDDKVKVRGQEEITKIVIMPSASTNSSQIPARQPVVFTATIIGVNDPAAARQVEQMVENSLRRVGRTLHG